jgi:hypothetical protein
VAEALYWIFVDLEFNIEKGKRSVGIEMVKVFLRYISYCT